MLKTVYAYGLRGGKRAAWTWPTCGTTRRPRSAGRHGGLFVRWGKAYRGGPPRRRTVLTVPEMDWIAGVLEHWVGEVRPAFGPGSLAALLVTGPGPAALSARAVDDAFTATSRAAWLPAELDLHCLRHAYITHLVEFDYPERFVSEQAGHRLCLHDRDLHRGVGRLPQPAGPPVAGGPARAVGGHAVNRKMGYQWNLRALMAARGMFATSDLVPLLAERGVHPVPRARSTGWSPPRRSGCRWTPWPRCATSSAPPRTT